MALNKFIDFKKLFDEEICSAITDNKKLVYPLQNKKVRFYVDNEIRDASLEVLDVYNKLLLDAVAEEYMEIKDKFIAPIVEDLDKDNFQIIRAKFYKSSNHYVVYFNVEDDDDELVFLGVANKTTENYLFLGSCGEHPFITTNHFVYDNSDGSGPNIPKFMGKKKITVHQILITMMKYYTEYTNNQYH